MKGRGRESDGAVNAHMDEAPVHGLCICTPAMYGRERELHRATNSPSQQVRGAIAGNRHEIGLLWQGDPLSPFAWFGEGHPRKGQHIAGKRVTQQPRGVLHLHG